MLRQIGFIGLGIMGSGMAKNLVKAGYPLNVYNRSLEKAEGLEKIGAFVAKSPKEVSARSGAIITMLSDSPAVENVILGDNGVLEGIRKGSVIVDCSTISPRVSVKIANEAEKKGVEMLDAPVAGSKRQAEEGTLIFLVGGKKQVYEDNMQILKAMGKNSFYIGQNGMGSYMKLVMNMINAINLQALAEALVFGMKAGIDPDLMVEIINSTGARSGGSEAKGKSMIKGNYETAFALKLMCKDMNLVREETRNLDVPTPTTSIVNELYTMAKVKGKSDLDYSVIMEVMKEMAGISQKQ
ncbi:MAG: NAD(P)-dependent oxidoreductase [Candidatus Bathyarchaeota archaeon]|jgi:3-hydroxyisobutyrate dehydrogenase-like beta-hydroxyacid dehydrogenase|nr:NAD(P)-dependent oxidoreductase [Candidatus Bathyarchaeota archaeon]